MDSILGCPSCNGVLQEPLSCEPCGHWACQTCFQSADTCPICQAPFTSVHRNVAFAAALKAIRVQAPSQCPDCHESFSPIEQVTHAFTCPCRPISCPCCPATCLRKELHPHLEGNVALHFLNLGESVHQVSRNLESIQQTEAALQQLSKENESLRKELRSTQESLRRLKGAVQVPKNFAWQCAVPKIGHSVRTPDLCCEGLYLHLEAIRRADEPDFMGLYISTRSANNRSCTISVSVSVGEGLGKSEERIENIPWEKLGEFRGWKRIWRVNGDSVEIRLEIRCVSLVVSNAVSSLSHTSPTLPPTTE
eukprot:NODE_489_length_1448_cov_99.913702_g455_i0.p1 GENE.NODE_489_length_1448_cov_99.913702_g455_i0~~NODE_489_length_1448_cov_99.913702_g455_i0.p1  ORF type:complete len:307 (-),score=24.35 NODE_489_length_1448_cov_99.913702_g455_i0:446-1366(-)